MEKFTILLIDDKEENIYSLKLILEDNFDDITIIDAMNVDEAILKIMTQDIHLILSDVQMPDIDGFDLIAYLKKVDETKDIPIILISAIFNDSKNMKKGFDLGAIDYITKPIDDDLLYSKLKVYKNIYEEKREIKNELEVGKEKMKSMISELNEFSEDLAKSFVQKNNLDELINEK